MPPTTPQRRATPRRATSHRNPSRATTPRRPLRRKQPDPSKAQQLMGMLGKAAPTKGASGSKKPMVAILGAGAAAAFTQRDKLAGLFGKGKGTTPENAPPERPVATPTSSAATTPPVSVTPPITPERPSGSGS